MTVLNKKKGFTLVELLVVIAIIAILAAVITPNAFKAIEKAKISAIVSDYRAVKNATLLYYYDVGEWPNQASWLVVNNSNAQAPPAVETPIPGWNGPYLDFWRDESPLGDGYNLFNEEYNAIVGPFIDLQGFAMYFLIFDPPQSLYDNLVKVPELGEVYYLNRSALEPKSIFIKIANMY